MISQIFWIVVVYLVLVRNKKIKCPHCGNKGASAEKKYLLSFIINIPFVRFRCYLCGGRYGAYFLPGILLNIITLPLLVMVMVNGAIKVNDRFLPEIILIPTFLFIPIILVIDLLIRIYIFPTKKYN